MRNVSFLSLFHFDLTHTVVFFHDVPFLSGYSFWLIDLSCLFSYKQTSHCTFHTFSMTSVFSSTSFSCLPCSSALSPSHLCVLTAICQLNSCVHLPGRKQSDSFGTIEVHEKKRGSITFLFTLFFPFMLCSCSCYTGNS